MGRGSRAEYSITSVLKPDSIGLDPAIHPSELSRLFVPKSQCNQTGAATLIAVHSVEVKLMTMCSRMVSVVEPLRQRSQPNSMPMQKVCKLPNQSYCVCA